MMLHEWYKCKDCQNAHPVGFDEFIKQQRKILLATKFSMDPLCFSQSAILFGDEEMYNEGCEEVENQINEWKEQGRLGDEAERESMMFHWRRLECELYVCKRIRQNEHVCTETIKTMYIFDENLPTRNFKTIAAMKLAANQHHLYYLVDKLFSSHSVNQWMELTSGATLKFAPIWFTVNRVYQFNVTVEFDKQFEGSSDMQKFNFKLKANQACLTIASYVGDTKQRLKTGVFSTPESVKFSTFGCQATMQEKPVYTELRLVYYAGCKAPRVWARSPLSTKSMPNCSSWNLAPIFADEGHFNLNGVISCMNGVQKNKAKLRSMVDQKIDENKNIMERLKKLSTV